jgi:hypothetical protein
MSASCGCDVPRRCVCDKYGGETILCDLIATSENASESDRHLTFFRAFLAEIKMPIHLLC